MEKNISNLPQEIVLSKSEKQPWGFRITGGADFGTPLTVIKVYGGSIAEEAGLQVGDVLLGINDQCLTHFNHQEAYEALINAGNSFTLRIIRESCYSSLQPDVTMDLNYKEEDAKVRFNAEKKSEELYEEETEKIYGLDAIVAAVLSQGLASQAATEFETFKEVYVSEETKQQFQDLTHTQNEQALNQIQHEEAAEINESCFTDFQEVHQQLQTEVSVTEVDATELQTLSEVNVDKAIEQALEDLSDVQLTSTIEKLTDVTQESKSLSLDENATIDNHCIGQLKTEITDQDYDISNSVYINQDMKVKCKETSDVQSENNLNLAEHTETVEVNFTVDKNLAVKMECKTNANATENEGSNSTCANQNIEEKCVESDHAQTEVTSNNEEQTYILQENESPFVEKTASFDLQCTEQSKTQTIVTKTNSKGFEACNNVHVNKDPKEEFEDFQTEETANKAEHVEAGTVNEICVVDENVNVDKQYAEHQLIAEFPTEAETSSKADVNKDAEQKCQDTCDVEAENASVRKITEAAPEKGSCNVNEGVTIDDQYEQQQSKNESIKTKLISEVKRAEESDKQDIEVGEQAPMTKKKKKKEQKSTVGKKKKSFTLTPQPRPVQLPGGFKFTFAEDVYDDEFIAETLSGNAEIIIGTTIGVNFQKYKRNYDYLKSSRVYQLIHEEESNDSDA